VLLCQFFRREIIFDVTYELRVKYKIGRRNRSSEGRNDRKMTPGEYPNFNSYVKIYLFWYSLQTDRQTDRRMDVQRH
jgi:hypothetical protein